MSNSKVIIVGWIRKGKPADCGETMKNQLLICKLEELGVLVRQMDFKGWRKRPWVFLQLMWNMLVHHDHTLILSSSSGNVYPFIKLMKFIHWHQNSVHWVIGGILGQKTIQGIYNPEIVGYVKHTIVESELMVKELSKCGVHNVICLPNFKPIDYYPSIINRKRGIPIRFVYLGRIMQEKGCDYILEAAQMLNENGMQEKYTVDFYGGIASSYTQSFMNKVEKIPNIRYAGFLNFMEHNAYDLLASYDVMLFPTYWKSEGFAGVFIDAFICGLPIIASDWMHNRQFLAEGKTALFIPVHNVPALCKKMYECINGKYDLLKMSSACRNEAEKYNVDNVITKELLSKIGIM